MLTISPSSCSGSSSFHKFLADWLKVPSRAEAERRLLACVDASGVGAASLRVVLATMASTRVPRYG